MLPDNPTGVKPRLTRSNLAKKFGERYAVEGQMRELHKMKTPSLREEKVLWERGFKVVIGLDEVGRGAFAGPVVAAAVAFHPKYTDLEYLGINDSKIVRPRARQRLALEIKKRSIAWSVAEIEVSTINRTGIGKATQMAFRKTIKKLLHPIVQKFSNCYVLIDGFHVRYVKGIGLKNQKAIIKGDQKSLSIAAASIIAKVHRDEIMGRLGRKYPSYKLAKNKGYGTREHREAIRKYGLLKVHRTSFNLQKFL